MNDDGARANVCACAYLDVDVYVRTYVCTYVCIYIHTDTCVCVGTDM